MGIGPLELAGGISRMQDFAILKQNDDHKVASQQSTLIQTEQEKVDEKANSVNRGDDVNNNNKRHDAKDKGNGEYSGDGGMHRDRNHEGEHHDGKVSVKTESTFDIRI